MWKNAEIVAEGVKYTDCKKGESAKEFRNFKDVSVSEIDGCDEADENMIFSFRCSVDLEQLFRYGVYEVALEDMPFDLKERYVKNNPELLYDWESFLEEVENDPVEAIGIDLCDFDQYSEYEKIKAELVNDAYIKYIDELWNCKKKRLEDKEFIANICKEFFEFVRYEKLFPIIEGNHIDFCHIGEGSHKYSNRESYFLLQCWARTQK